MNGICSSVFTRVMGNPKVRCCFLCVTKAFRLGQSHETFADLCRTFYNGHTLALHFSSTVMEVKKEQEVTEEARLMNRTCSPKM